MGEEEPVEDLDAILEEIDADASPTINYFVMNHGPAASTSDHAFNEISLPSQSEQKDIFRKLPRKHAKAKATMLERYTRSFRKWFIQIRAGFNLLFYGLGSKKMLLQRFAEEWLSDAPLVIINGYFNKLTIKQIVTSISQALPRGSASTTSAFSLSSSSAASSISPDVLSELNTIQAKLAASPDRHIYVLIHNIDAPNLRSSSVQNALSCLAAMPRLHLLASIDHIHAPLLWDFTCLNRFRWLWHHLTTFEPYRFEIISCNKTGTVQDQERQTRSVQNILASLTPNHKAMLVTLAQAQLGDEKEGLSFEKWLLLCEEAMIVNNDIAFRGMLQELLDHHIVRLARRTDGSQRYEITLEESLIRQQVLSEN
eukprot:TRINITY_DN14212_c0_g1_i2.p1 TRINITY_DN14212_c0_g1~~TRINITY_DN14212_c0_g1_i2.p1  ORF type:complete len:377 (-),score=76.03 TRINITY_DN14212_c0_g1_i2:18-1124(-)